MPMIPEAVFGMLACARIGAIHSVVFGGFSSLELCNQNFKFSCSVNIRFLQLELMTQNQK
jgi:acyl-coenzyme A synthetase/AMP-(fatty) acid ligase